MKAVILSLVLLGSTVASTVASASTQCTGVTDRMNLQLVQKENSVAVKYQMNPRDYSKYADPSGGLTIAFQEGMAYDVQGTNLDGLLQKKEVLTKLVVNGILRTAYFAGEEDMVYVEAGDLIAALKCQ
ncbi:hypothetical protein ACLVWU_02630 [Bdellovibrio sp. HCB290]|uniref:hypothetical protein n=1 Tax=Bdellovibrio sp. HCB290 TaxID=3394356 RepID=UPI0039B61C1C